MNRFDDKKEKVGSTISKQEATKKEPATSGKGKNSKKSEDTKKASGGFFSSFFGKKEEATPQIPEGTVRKDYPSIADQYTSSTIGTIESAKPMYRYKPLVDKKLTILFIENTRQVVEQLNMIIKIVSHIVAEGDVCVINYGSTCTQSEIMSVAQWKKEMMANQLQNKTTLVGQDIGEDACLFNALVALEILVNQKMLSIEEGVTQRTQISNIDIIGIGTGKEQGSKVLKEFALKAFARVAKKHKVVTKYFCLTEASFSKVAEIGFHSIGSIDRTY